MSDHAPARRRPDAVRKYDRNLRGSRLGGLNRIRGVHRIDDRDATAHQLGHQRRQSMVLTIRPAVFDSDVSAVDMVGFSEAPMKCGRVIYGRLT